MGGTGRSARVGWLGLCRTDGDSLHLRALLVLRQGLRHHLYVHVGAVYVPTLPLRSVDEAGLEVDDSACHVQSLDNGGRNTREKTVLGCSMSGFVNTSRSDVTELLRLTFGNRDTKFMSTE